MSRARGILVAMDDDELRAVLRSGYEALSRGDVDAVLALLADDVELRDRAEAPEAGVYHGHDGARVAFQQTDDTFENYRIRPTAIELGPVRDGGIRNVVVVLRQEGEGRLTGVRVSEDIAHVLTLKDDVAIRLRVFSTPDEARAASLES
ncbi:MAG TPA: nuclear transport factor 2 family protein [Thermoleophilaceae bacterium]